MPGGYAGKILAVNLSEGKIGSVEPEESILRHYIGGRGLATKILWDGLGSRWEDVDPLGAENLLVIVTGPITGYIPGGRICVSGKSPLTNGIVGSTVSGEFPIELKCSGFDGLIISGRSEKPVYVLVTDGHAEIRKADGIWGLDGKQLIRALNHEVVDHLSNAEPRYGEWKEPGILYIGPAGETLNRTAAVMQKWSHAAGYGGYGAVMGSKNLKAIAVKGTGPLPEVENREEVISCLNQILEGTFKSGPLSQLMRLWGTTRNNYPTGFSLSSMPVRNWQEEWHDEKSIGADKFARRLWVKRYWADYGCPVACMKIAVVKTGPFKGAISDGPDYELVAYCGSNLGIFDPDGITYVSCVVDDLGLSGINGANVMGFAAELYQRGILTREDFGGVEPRWGDAEAFGKLAHLIAERRGIGDILAEGTYRAALKISKMKGVDVLPFAVQFKGMEVGAHGIRSGLDWTGSWPMSYALSTQPGDHGSISSAEGEARSILSDSLVYCNISYRAKPDLLYKLFKAITGWDLTPDDWANNKGRRIMQIQRAALLIGGPDVAWDPVKHDDNPPRWYDALSTGPSKGAAPKREYCLKLKREYYRTVGWDVKGIPTSDELRKLGLGDVDVALEKLRKN